MPLNISNFAVRYGWEGSRPDVVEELAAIDTDLLIMGGVFMGNAGADVNFTPSDIAAIKAGAGGKMAIGYMSIGAVLDFQDNYSGFAPHVVSSDGATRYLAYWDPDGVDDVNTDLVIAFEGWIDQLKAQGFDGAFLDVPVTYNLPFVLEHIPGASQAEDYIIATTALMTLVAELKDHAGPDFKLILGHSPFLIGNHYFPDENGGPANPNPDEALVARFRAALDGVLTESLHFADRAPIDDYIINMMQPGAPYGFGDATRLVIDYFDAGGSFEPGEELALKARIFQIEAALEGWIPYAAPTTASGDGIFGSTYAQFNVATAQGDALLAALSGGTLNGGAGEDYVRGREGADFLSGGADNDLIVADAGNDTLDGGAGADTMRGGADNDVYYVNDAGDVVVEEGGAGTDVVRSSITYELGAHIEGLTIVGSGARSGTGNILNNVMTGNDAANKLRGAQGNDTIAAGGGGDTLDGGAGVDFLRGEAGDDTYEVDSADDFVRELANGGVDTVRTSITRALDPNAENLVIAGGAARNGSGNSQDNVIAGNSAANTLAGRLGNDTVAGGGGNDKLNGGEGADVLTGGAGQDAFVFDAPRVGANSDTVTDFNVADDTILLDNAIFTQLGADGALNASMFRIGSGPADANDVLYYNATTGALYYDANANAAGGAFRIATLAPGLALTAADFLVT